jgi:DNA-binding response OmpR family regulator
MASQYPIFHLSRVRGYPRSFGCVILYAGLTSEGGVETMSNRVLIVDGDAHNRLLMEVGLSGAGVDVVACATLEAAHLALSDAPVDLIVGEIDLPDAPPFSLTDLRDKDERLAETPMIYMTDRRKVEDKIEGLERGADDYLTKPIYLREFVTRVIGYLRRREVTRLTPRGLRQHYSGHLSQDLVHDIVRSMLDGRLSGRLELLRKGRPGRLTFHEGELVNAEVDRVNGEEAAVRLMLWESGDFEVFFETVQDQERIGKRSETVIDLALRRRRQWERLCALRSEFSDLALADVLSLMDLAPPHPDGLDELLGLFSISALEVNTPPDPGALRLEWSPLSEWVHDRLKIAGRASVPGLSERLEGVDATETDSTLEAESPPEDLAAMFFHEEEARIVEAARATHSTLPGLERPEVEPAPHEDLDKNKD